MKQEDELYFAQARRRLVAGIREKGITDEAVLASIDAVPRHLFMRPDLVAEAYVDKAFPIDEGQTISQPYTVAYQTQLLRAGASCRVLEIGTGSGYQASVLVALGAEVFTIERQKRLFDKNKRFAYLQQLPRLHLFYGDGYEGLPRFAPFDRILVTAAAPEIPSKLVDQLGAGGILVLPLGRERVQQMVRLNRLPDGQLMQETFDNFSFVPMLQGIKE